MIRSTTIVLALLGSLSLAAGERAVEKPSDTQRAAKHQQWVEIQSMSQSIHKPGSGQRAVGGSQTLSTGANRSQTASETSCNGVEACNDMIATCIALGGSVTQTSYDPGTGSPDGANCYSPSGG